jgi:predicted dehydrogenase
VFHPWLKFPVFVPFVFFVVGVWHIRWHNPAVSVSAQNSVRVAVIGTGSLGQHHARIYAEMAASGAVHFAGVYDVNPATARTYAEKYNTRAFGSLHEAADACDALSIVTPTVTHFSIGKDLIQRGKHLLIEKPITDDMEQAGELVQLAHRHNCLIQVGHIERFNPVFKYLESVASAPRFIESHRLSPHPGRGADVGVILDLMIHDLDIVLAFVNSPVVNVDAVGIAVLSKSEDIANARLKFANGCIANLTVSRVSAERMRKIRVFSGGPQPNYISLDYREQKGFIYRLAPDQERESSLIKKLLHADDAAIVSEFAGRKIVRDPVPITKEEPLKLELRHFVDCVREQQRPLVDGEAAMRALDLALEITRQVQAIGAKENASAHL